MTNLDREKEPSHCYRRQSYKYEWKKNAQRDANTARWL